MVPTKQKNSLGNNSGNSLPSLKENSCFESWWHVKVSYSYFWMTSVSECSFSPKRVQLSYTDNYVLSVIVLPICVLHTLWTSKHICLVSFICTCDQPAYFLGTRFLKCIYYLYRVTYLYYCIFIKVPSSYFLFRKQNKKQWI